MCSGYEIFICVIFGSGDIIAATGSIDHAPEVDCCDLGNRRHGGACAGPRTTPSGDGRTKVVEIISSDSAKVETYCAIGKLGVQIEDANEAKDKKTADVLTEKMRGLEKQLGPEYLSLMYGLQEIDPEFDDGVEIEAMLRPLDRSCAQE